MLANVEHGFDFVGLLIVGYPVGCRVNLYSSLQYYGDIYPSHLDPYQAYAWTHYSTSPILSPNCFQCRPRNEMLVSDEFLGARA